MSDINEATSVDLKVIEELKKIGWKVGDTLLYQQEFSLSNEQQKLFKGKKSIKPDIVLTDIQGNIIAVIENKFIDEKKALIKLIGLYQTVLNSKFLYACSKKRILFYDLNWKGKEAIEFKRVKTFMSLEDMKLKIEQYKEITQIKNIEIDKTIAGGFDKAAGKERYYQFDCINILLDKYKNGKQKMLVHMATGLGKTRTMVAFVKALLKYNIAGRILFVVDRVLLADQALNDGFGLISKEFTATRLTSQNYRINKHSKIHVIVIDTLEIIYDKIPNNFYDLIIVDECHRSITINRKLIFDHFICPRIGLTATPKKVITEKNKEISEEDLAILDTYKLFGCETGEPDYQFDLDKGINEGFLAPYKVIQIETELTKMARENGIEFSYVLDPDERKKIELDNKKKLTLEQLEKKYISIERCQRIAEEIKKNTKYGEKIILFGVSQAHCHNLVSTLNKVFATDDDEQYPRYAEAIISDNNDLNATLKRWFKDKHYDKPYIAVSVDIMSTGIDVPCVRYIVFTSITKSVGKYIQMLGRGTRLDPKTGKFSFTVIDFVGLCNLMKDNGKGTNKPNEEIVNKINSGKGSTNKKKKNKLTASYFYIDNPDPANLIQRTYIDNEHVKIIDNIPIEEAKKLFENEVINTCKEEIINIKNKIKENFNYEPNEKEVEDVKEWIKNPEIYLTEDQLQTIYDYKGGSIWDIILHVLNIKHIPTKKDRIEKGFDSFVDTKDFTDEQIDILKNLKEIVSANLIENNNLNPDEIFSNPIYTQIIGGDYNQINNIFNGNINDIFSQMKNSFYI